MEGQTPPLPREVERLLPPALAAEIARRATGAVEELRLKRGRRCWMVCDGRNVMLDEIMTERQISDALTRICGGSAYAFADGIRQGFLPYEGGVRVGLVGRACSENGKTVSVREISTLCLRIPTHARVEVGTLLSLLRGFDRVWGLLLYAPPGGGKTTALRALARGLSSGESPRRVVVVDTRGELSTGLSGRNLCVDILRGYPRREGMEIAARSLGAEAVICDEICGAEDAEAVIGLVSGGVPVIASAHGASLGGLLTSADMRALHRAMAFGAYVRIDRTAPRLFSVTEWREVPSDVAL